MRMILSTTPERETFNGSETSSQKWDAEISVRGLSSDFHDRACCSHGKWWHTGDRTAPINCKSRFEHEGKHFTEESREVVRGYERRSLDFPSIFFTLSGSVLRLRGCLRVASLRLQFGYWPVSAPWCWSSLWDSAQSCGSGSGSLTDWWPRRCWRRTVRETPYRSNLNREMGHSSRMWRTSNRWEMVLFRRGDVSHLSFWHPDEIWNKLMESFELPHNCSLNLTWTRTCYTWAHALVPEMTVGAHQCPMRSR